MEGQVECIALWDSITYSALVLANVDAKSFILECLCTSFQFLICMRVLHSVQWWEPSGRALVRSSECFCIDLLMKNISFSFSFESLRKLFITGYSLRLTINTFNSITQTIYLLTDVNPHRCCFGDKCYKICGLFRTLNN